MKDNHFERNVAISSVVALKQWTVSEIWNDHVSVTAAQTDVTSPTDRNDADNVLFLHSDTTLKFIRSMLNSIACCDLTR